MAFQSTPPARGATEQQPTQAQLQAISIHAPREGGDSGVCRTRMDRLISIHAPREGGDASPYSAFARKTDFNPRPPRGGRRRCPPALHLTAIFQSTPPARGATVIPMIPMAPLDISIHAPREGGDLGTLPSCPVHTISIHAPREGGDTVRLRWRFPAADFNPRPPRGGRPVFSWG